LSNPVTTAGSSPGDKPKTPKFDALSDRRKRFVEEYMITLNATRAALAAGYSPDTARSQGSRLLTFVDIGEAISELASIRTGLSKVWVLDQIAQDAQTGLGNFAEWDAAGNLTMKASDELTEEQRLRINIKRTWGKSPSLEVKLVDRQAALFKLAEVFGLTKQPAQVGGDINIGQAVFVRAPVASREDWEKQMRELNEERARQDAGLIEGKVIK